VKKYRFFFSFFLLILSACQPTLHTISTPTRQPDRSPSPSPVVQGLPTRTSSPQTRATPTTLTTPAFTPEDPSITPDANSGPLHFVFPTQAARPISSWRPPLYSVPWAMTPNDHFFFVRPIAADEVNWGEADYRYGALWPGLVNVIHTGMDIDAPLRTPILAAGPGKIVWAGEGLMYGPGVPNDPYGLAVAILHDFGYQGQQLETIYGHMSRIDVVVGQHVETGDQLGLVGTTGLTTGPHVHFEVRIQEGDFFNTRNPELWLAPPQGWGVLAGRVMDSMGNKIYHLDVTVTSQQSSQVWTVDTYADDIMAKSDDYYRENLALSDLPAGLYTISLVYMDETYKQNIRINPGMVSYFTFQGIYKYSTSLPATPEPDFAVTATKAP